MTKPWASLIIDTHDTCKCSKRWLVADPFVDNNDEWCKLRYCNTVYMLMSTITQHSLTRERISTCTS